MRDGKHVILYVEDDEDYRFAVRQMLEAHGFEMVEAPDGEAGLRAIREHHPDLIILDLMMEEVDAGVNLLKQIRAADRDTPVYLLSSVGDTMTMTASAAELGFKGVFQKPIDADQFVTILRAKLAT